LLPVAVDWANWSETVLDEYESMSERMDQWLAEYGQNICPEIEVPASMKEPKDGCAGDPVVPGRHDTKNHLTVPSDRELIPAWDQSWWELDAEMAALALLEAEE